MRRTIYKLFWAWDYDKEEKWLNEMASKGLSLIAVGFYKYTFEDCTPGEYSIRLELLENMPTHTQSYKYIKFIEETGAEYLGSIMRWVYFRKKVTCENFDLYSDNDSRIKHLNRMLLLIGVISLLNIFIWIGSIATHFSFNISSNFILGIFNLSFGLFAGWGYLKINKKKQKLKKDKRLFE